LPSSKLHKATILFHKPAGRGYYRLALKAPGVASTAAPGQFVMLRVSENMDPLLARPFGISSVISKTSIEIYYRVAGRGTLLLTAMEPGHALTLQGPIGNGFPMPEKGVTPLLVAGGSGFPPLHFFSMKTGSRAHLFVGARNKECLPPAGVIKSFRQNMKKVYIATEDGSMGKRGLVTELLPSLIADLDDASKIAIYACGPRPMLAAVALIAAERSIRCYVSMEERMACGLGACMGCSVGMKAGGYGRVCKEGPVFDAREIDWRESRV
jgi:dihydroorotate dehydrogenase electron transfer subunit